ncbi:MAG: glycoside hydrolase family 25 protein [Qipengyuania sp.]
MARRISRRTAKRKGPGWGARLIALVLLLAMIGAAVGWWKGRQWRPDEARWPDQGALVSQENGEVNFGTLKGLGASFVYLEASRGEEGQHAAFPDSRATAHAARLQTGAVHVFDPCALADGQSANFVTMVPRDVELLPPVIALRETAEDCPQSVSRAAIQSELMTLVNQIEAHAGKPAILLLSEEFEERYGVAARIDRNLWLERDWFEPGYAGRPWLLWTANAKLVTEAADEPLAWAVVRP